MNTAAVVLAAGQGTRMNSDLPKVLHEVDGRPMVRFVIDAVKKIEVDRIILVIGYQGERVEAACAGLDVDFVWQHEQLGTGHAVVQAESILRDLDGTVIVLNGDVPGLRAETLRKFVGYHNAESAMATVLTAKMEDATGYGRIVRDPEGGLLKIVEHCDADAATLAINEVNSGLFCFDAKALFAALKSTNRENSQNEYYLTDVVEMLRDGGEKVLAWCVEDPREVAGVNTADELGSVSAFMRESE